MGRQRRGQGGLLPLLDAQVHRARGGAPRAGAHRLRDPSGATHHRGAASHLTLAPPLLCAACRLALTVMSREDPLETFLKQLPRSQAVQREGDLFSLEVIFPVRGSTGVHVYTQARAGAAAHPPRTCSSPRSCVCCCWRTWAGEPGRQAGAAQAVARGGAALQHAQARLGERNLADGGHVLGDAHHLVGQVALLEPPGLG